ncbi:hypothetical protein [Chrysiogenes arsenatis]|uniref:hypothetical protein n=1 Tax=Chrysiogenes arsenatis TaxID=309797 RepID=UPI00047F521C|nr:hypothetical protein [Chrysiogenes arsenatis]
MSKVSFPVRIAFVLLAVAVVVSGGFAWQAAQLNAERAEFRSQVTQVERLAQRYLELRQQGVLESRSLLDEVNHRVQNHRLQPFLENIERQENGGLVLVLRNVQNPEALYRFLEELAALPWLLMDGTLERVDDDSARTFVTLSLQLQLR